MIAEKRGARPTVFFGFPSERPSNRESYGCAIRQSKVVAQASLPSTTPIRAQWRATLRSCDGRQYLGQTHVYPGTDRPACTTGCSNNMCSNKRHADATHLKLTPTHALSSNNNPPQAHNALPQLFSYRVRPGLAAHVLKGREPWSFRNGRKDADTTLPVGDPACPPIEYPKPDGVLSFDLLSNLALSGVKHEHDQPAHLRVKEGLEDVAPEVGVVSVLSSRRAPLECRRSCLLGAVCIICSHC